VLLAQRNARQSPIEVAELQAAQSSEAQAQGGLPCQTTISGAWPVLALPERSNKLLWLVFTG
jgi:hypothetical protein